jgi:tryptophanyl-tRNA synthetase
MGIETDSTPPEEPKNPDTCNAFAIYSLLASAEQLAAMRANYLEVIMVMVMPNKRCLS